MARKKQQNMQRKPVDSRNMRAMEAIVKEKIDEVAAFAWSGYQAEGRGIVLFSFNGTEVDTQYHGKNGDFWGIMEIEANFPEINQLVDEYQPKTQFVAVLVTGKEVNAYLFDEMPLPPPLAYEKQTADS